MRAIRLYIFQPLKASMLLGVLLFLLKWVIGPYNAFFLLVSLVLPVFLFIGVFIILTGLIYFLTWMSSGTTEC
ncbi:MAG: hypothetical protein ACKVQV_15160 [Bacteroidia bacterium]